MTPDQMEHLAEQVSEKTVQRVFLALGIDLTDHKEIPKLQRDLAHLRMWRESTEAIQRRGLLAAVTVFVTAGLGWLMTYFFKWH